MTFPKFKTQDEVPEAFRDLYVEQDGEWVAAEDDAAEVKSALEKEREDRKRFEKEAKDAKKALEELNRKKAANDAGVPEEVLAKLREQVRADLVSEFEDQIAEKDKQIADLGGVVNENRELRLSEVKSMLAGAGVIGDRLDPFWQIVKDRFDLTPDKKPVIKGKPGTDVKRYLADQLKKEFPYFYQGSQGGGGGAGGAQGEGGSGGNVTIDQILSNPAAALDAARAGGVK